MSITIYLQFIGRVLRPMQGKKYGIIVDPVGNYFIHGRPEMERKWTLKGREENQEKELLSPEMKICPQCGIMNAKINLRCHICDYDFVEDKLKTSHARKLPVMIDGKLVILDGEELATRKEEIQDGLAEQRKKQLKQDNNEEKKENLKTITKNEKVQLLKDGLNGKKDLFSRAVKEWL
jgi:superfamily II DNA or RNA helicase